MIEDGKAAIVSDFRQDGDGLTRILMLDRGMSPARNGAVSQRVIDIETYRTLAMLGLPMALQPVRPGAPHRGSAGANHP